MPKKVSKTLIKKNYIKNCLNYYFFFNSKSCNAKKMNSKDCRKKFNILIKAEKKSECQ